MRQAKSKQKILDKMEAVGLTKPVVHTRSFTFTFPDCDKLPPPVLPFIDVSFAYSGKEEDMLYRVSPCRHLSVCRRRVMRLLLSWLLPAKCKPPLLCSVIQGTVRCMERAWLCWGCCGVLLSFAESLEEK